MRNLLRVSFLFLSASLMPGCSPTQPSTLSQSIYLVRDKDGIYSYEPRTKTEKQAYKAAPEQIFLEKPPVITADTLRFGIKGEHKLNIDSMGRESYFEDYYSVDLNTRHSWLSGKTTYTLADRNLNIQEQIIDQNGNSRITSDTTVPWTSTSGSFKGVIYNADWRYYSAHKQGNKTVFSQSGNIYLVIGSDTSLLVKFEGEFDPKFGSGYYQPQFDPKGEYVVYRFLPGFMSLGPQSLRKIDLRTKKTETLKKGEFREPQFSADGNFILFHRNYRQSNDKMWINDVYILDLANMEETYIGNAYSAFWGM